MRQNKAFTLVELLVVISIIALLMALLLPALSKARDSARRMVCATQIRQLALSLNGYAFDNKGWFPMVISTNAWVFTNSEGQGSADAILPYLTGSSDRSAAAIKMLMCPDRDPGLTASTVDQTADRLGTTYQVIAARGSGAGWNNSFLEAVVANGSLRYYGWLSANAHPSSPAVNRFSPVPRDSLFDVRLAPSTQPISADLFWNDTGFFNSSYLYTRLGRTAYYPVRSNHIEGSNVAFLDGHVKWSSQTNCNRYVRYYSSNDTSAIWWSHP